MRVAKWILLTGLIAPAVFSLSGAHAGDFNPTQDDLVWQLPDQVPYPANNAPTPERVALGKMLFFDPRLSVDGSIACAGCHNPGLGWSDGLPTGRGFHGKKLDRATPSIYNAAFNSVQMWDGRKSSLEDQATGPMDSPNEMAADYDAMFTFLKGTPGYASAFAKAYPGEPIDKVTLSKAIASFERTIVSNNSRFDRWLRGEPNQLTAREVHGFRVFLDPDKGNCATCHKAPNFTDNGFHNIGLPSYGAETPDVGRFAIKPVKLMNGAFKTPSLRNAGRESHYFHDGSMSTLEEVVDHYVRGGDIKTNLSPNIKPLNLSDDEKRDLVAFLHSLDNQSAPVTFPELP